MRTGYGATVVNAIPITNYQPYRAFEVGVEVRPSTVHGLGVFTTTSFKEGDLVCRYSGDCLRNVTGNESKYMLGQMLQSVLRKWPRH